MKTAASSTEFAFCRVKDCMKSTHVSLLCNKEKLTVVAACFPTKDELLNTVSVIHGLPVMSGTRCREKQNS